MSRTRPAVECSGHSTVPARRIGPGPQRQRGWAGLVLLLIALVIAGWLARTALRQLAPADPAARTPAAANDPTTASPAAAVQRAKNVESEILKRAEEAQQKIDATEK